MRVLLAAAEQVAGLHQLVASLVNRRRLVVDGTDQGELVGALGHEGEMFAELHAGDVGVDRPKGAADVLGRPGLQVPGVKVTGGADEKEDDTVEVAVRPPGRPEAREVGERQPDGAGAERAHAEEIAPGQAVTEADTLFALQVQHGGPPGLPMRSTMGGVKGKTPRGATPSGGASEVLWYRGGAGLQSESATVAETHTSRETSAPRLVKRCARGCERGPLFVFRRVHLFVLDGSVFRP